MELFPQIRSRTLTCKWGSFSAMVWSIIRASPAPMSKTLTQRPCPSSAGTPLFTALAKLFSVPFGWLVRYLSNLWAATVLVRSKPGEYPHQLMLPWPCIVCAPVIKLWLSFDRKLIGIFGNKFWDKKIGIF